MIAWILSGSPSSPLIFRIIKFVPFSLPVNVVFFKYGMEIIPVRSIITTSFLLFHCKLLKCSLYLHHKPPYRNHYTPFLSTKHQEYLMLAVFLSPVYLLFQAYILLWLYAWADSCSPALHSLFFRIPVTVLYLFFAVSPLTGFLITKEPLHHFLRVISNYWLGTLEYILLFIITFDVIRRVTGHSFFMKYRYPAMLHTMPKNLVIFGGFAIGLILMVSIYGVLHARRVYVRQDPVVIEKSSSLPGLKIALIADLHLGYNSTKSHVRKIVDTINSQNVDLVCIAGDLFDNDYNAIKDPDEVADILSDIKSRYGTYACWGNHDVSEKILAGFTFPQKETIVRDGRFTEFLHHAGITMLEDETVCINNAFYLVGRRDKDMAKKEQLPRKTFAEITEPLDPSLPIIVMDHQPGELSEASDAGVDLDLSGHTHDGQMFPANLVVHFLWENACGVLKKGAMTSIVTSGAGVWGPAMRVGTNNEVVIANVSFDPATDQ
ncbi:metallophosphoesterase [Clostridiaceae bacterium TF01-6]|nr:metallophosphoesterase [Clostridiaceae bacterium AF02-42]RGE11771.1 metallophosphoesterase [Clostridiaceae bacterium TF01-6]